MSSIYSYKSISQQFKDVDLKGRMVSGYFSAFNVKDSDGDIILPGAFKKSIDERGPKSNRPRIKWFLNHDSWQVPGVLKELQEDSYGLAYTGVVGTHNLGNDFLKMVDSGIITEHSHGFRIVTEERRDDVNYIKESYLYEGSSLTAWGANEFTPLTGVKQQFDKERIIERIKRLEKFCKDSDATDETIEALLIEVKQLSQLVVSLTTEPEQSTQPEKEEKAINLDVAAIYTHLQTIKF